MKRNIRHFRDYNILSEALAPCVVASSGCARMGARIVNTPSSMPQEMKRETKDEHSSKTIVRGCGIGFRSIRGNSPGAGADLAGMQRKISGRQDRRHAQLPEVE